MKCPKCKTVDLRATKLEDGLPAHGCDSCGGSMITLLYYRDWAERTLNDVVTEPHSATEIKPDSDSFAAMSCPKCSKLMTKYKISGHSKNRLDLCGSCDEAWVDGGEWELLKSLKLSKKIPSVFTDSWQRKVRKEVSANILKDRFTTIFGETDMARLDDIKAWVKDHPKRAEILFYIGKK